MKERVYHGERECEGATHAGKPCTNNAYWYLHKKLLCGVHTKQHATTRKPLPKRTPAELRVTRRTKELEQAYTVDAAAKENRASGRMGKLTLQRQRMMHMSTVTPGVRNVYPNFKDQNRAFGFGCCALSPKAMGPIVHGQPGLPNARKLENFHQGSKAFAEELGDDGEPGPLHCENRERFYLDPEPHRHKYKGCDGNPNIPKFFVWVDKDGKDHHLTYIQSRQFYCTFYERLAMKEPDYIHLGDLLRLGINLEICGYDGNPLKEGETVDDAYLDDSVPFGHERVLYTMLLFMVLGRPKCDYPWRKNTMFDF